MNEDVFTGKAEVYAKYRPSYAEKFIEHLYTEVGFKNSSIIADVGSGTGIFSKILLKKGSTVYLIEPNKDMHERAKNSLTEYQNCFCVNSSAEKIELKDKSVDFVTAAQAFHWFDRELFKGECKRILRPGGKVVLTWNSRITDSPLVMENDEINRRHCADYKGFSAGNNLVDSEEYKQFFKNVDYREFKNNLYFSNENFIGRNLSSSYAPKPDTVEYKLYTSELNKLFNKYEQSGKVLMPNITISYIGEV